MLVSMTLTLMQGHSGSAKATILGWIISTTKPATGIKLSTTVGHFGGTLTLRTFIWLDQLVLGLFLFLFRGVLSFGQGMWVDVLYIFECGVVFFIYRSIKQHSDDLDKALTCKSLAKVTVAILRVVFCGTAAGRSAEFWCKTFRFSKGMNEAPEVS